MAILYSVENEYENDDEDDSARMTTESINQLYGKV